MPGLHLQTSAPKCEPPDPALEVERLEALLAERRAELTALQAELRDFKALYAEVVGSRLAELSEVEREIRRAEARLVGLDEDAYGGEEDAAHFYEPTPKASRRSSATNTYNPTAPRPRATTSRKTSPRASSN